MEICGRVVDQEVFVRSTCFGVLKLLLRDPRGLSAVRQIKKDEEIWELVLEALGDSEAIVRRQAVETLGVALTYIHTLLSLGQPEGSTSWATFFHRTMQDPDWEVRVRFVTAMGVLFEEPRSRALFYSGDAGTLLLEALSESEFQVTETVITVLTALKAKILEFPCGPQEKETKMAEHFRATLEQTNLPELLRRLKAEEEVPDRIDFDDIFSHIHVCDNTLDCY